MGLSLWLGSTLVCHLSICLLQTSVYYGALFLFPQNCALQNPLHTYKHGDNITGILVSPDSTLRNKRPDTTKSGSIFGFTLCKALLLVVHTAGLLFTIGYAPLNIYSRLEDFSVLFLTLSFCRQQVFKKRVPLRDRQKQWRGPPCRFAFIIIPYRAAESGRFRGRSIQCPGHAVTRHMGTTPSRRH